MPPLELTAADHEGGGWVQIFTVKGGKLTKQSDWFRAYPELIKKHIEADAKKS
jgi:branched-chain amino acid transport system substrate-binding protein